MAVCKKCGLRIAFRKLDNGKWMPVNIDNSEHWDTCSQERIRLGLYNKPLRDPPIKVTGKNFKASYDPHDESIPFDPPYMVMKR